jgi:hypothetical protein
MAINKELVRVYGHPRSGNNFLLNLLYKNFYSDHNMDQKAAIWQTGHWSRRPVRKMGDTTFYVEGENAGRRFTIPYSTLFGSHKFNCRDKRGIYILRDGRDVALSCWSWKGAMNIKWKDITFAQYIRRPIDWTGSFGARDPKRKNNIFQHWMKHIKNYKHMYWVRYEDLVLDLDNQLERIAEHYGLEFVGDGHQDSEIVGWAPTGSVKIAKWQNVMTDKDLAIYDKFVPKGFRGRYDGKGESCEV